MERAIKDKRPQKKMVGPFFVSSAQLESDFINAAVRKTKESLAELLQSSGFGLELQNTGVVTDICTQEHAPRRFIVRKP